MNRTEAESFWNKLRNDVINHHAGPMRTTKWSKARDAVRNKLEVTKTETLNRFGAGKGVAAIAATAMKNVPLAVPGVGFAISAIKGLIGIGIDLAKAGAVDKSIGRVPDGAPNDAKTDLGPLTVQLLDTRAGALLAELTRLDTKLEGLRSVFYDSCVGWEDQLNRYAEAVYLNNRLSQHHAYLEAIATKLKKVTAETTTALHDVETQMKDETIKRFTEQPQQKPENWHNHFCMNKKCLYPFPY